MVVLYYTKVSFTDLALEIVNALKKEVQLHLVIELSPESKSGTIVSTLDLDDKPVLCKPEEILTKECFSQLKKYFDGCASVMFYVQKNKKTFTPDNYLYGRKLAKYIDGLKPDLLHFDTVSQRSLGLIPYIYFNYRKKLVIAVHDPVPHSKEGSWKLKITDKLFHPIAGAFLLYSEYSKKIFKSVVNNDRKVPVEVLRMKPYMSYRDHLKADYSETGNYILFFGRISFYKGIDTLFKSIPKVLKYYPDLQFKIAGSNYPGYSVDQNLLEPIKENVIFENRYIPHEELVNMIQKSSFVVCPYKEATQSGVLMTAFACSRTVIASNVGAFSEYITDGVNGKLCEEGDAEALADAMLFLLKDNTYKTFNNTVNSETIRNDWSGNVSILLKTYHAILKGDEK
jgi:glycosyltransferase involved in cell wall biosynthesis